MNPRGQRITELVVLLFIFGFIGLAVALVAPPQLLGGAPTECMYLGGARIEYHEHTTLTEAGLPTGNSAARGRQPGELWVTADAVLLPQGGADLSSPRPEPPKARMYCFHADGGDGWMTGVLPNGWSPPDTR